MFYKKLVSLQRAQEGRGSLYVKAFLYGNGDNGRTVNDFSAEAILQCLTDEGITMLASGKMPTSAQYKSQEEIDAMPVEAVQNVDKVPMALPYPCLLCDTNGNPRIGGDSKPIVVDQVSVTVMWDTNMVMQRDPVTHLPMLNPYNGGQFVYAPEVDAQGREIRIYRKSWSPQERLDSMFKAGMLKKANVQATSTTPPAGASQPNAAAPDPMAATRAAAMATLMGTGVAPQPQPLPGVTIPNQPLPGVTIPNQPQPGAPLPGETM